jgi:hypothetical protein
LFALTITARSELDRNGLVLFAWTTVLGTPKVSMMCCFELDVLMLVRSLLDVGSLYGFIIEHTPLPVHAPGHRCSHRSPANPLSHSHVGIPRSSWLQVPWWLQNVSQGVSQVAPPHVGAHSQTGRPPGKPVGLQTPWPPHWCKHHLMLQSLPDQPSWHVHVNVSLPSLPSLHVPWPEQSFSHRRIPHPMPVKFALHVQRPWLHMPFPLHCCGHATNPHALPCQPMSHKQPSAVQVPWWEQF